ncbi:predicted protein [Aspergillus nidulans FGSC A4]|uniref:Uncharacterized protein n=1 Tax=Emericella nidulans (strain FGSC A4 / ATCC 38163 / CBS 112.46 / NRRL 194 / M139) TaxID=227321 RepID=Q5AQU6_EMENI|nr:hypothetical protein [Aspergillus nidulans FGSC A4]EAA66401.1 predicted protein [Aspergillus nidulans FGSC A4]CBF87422.1 TPA: hypothetical protein ANIA_09334 [Aspergillus nidulans FGSC A4]|eukprot:XP_682603.1 predicted protein [Aspergillus nidulans FGSC A4]
MWDYKSRRILILLDNIYNFDKTGFAMGLCEYQKPIYELKSAYNQVEGMADNQDPGHSLSQQSETVFEQQD